MIRRPVFAHDALWNWVERVCRVCGRWVVGLGILGICTALIGTWQGVETWREETHWRRLGGPFRPVATRLDRQKRQTFAAASVSAAYGTTFVIVARRRWVRHKRTASNQCIDCGYDLTGNTSGVCPECGTPVTGKESA